MKYYINSLLLAFIVISTGCGTAPTTPRPTDPQFRPYLDRFIKLASAYGYGTVSWDRIPITLNSSANDVNADAIATCYDFTGLAPEARGDYNYVYFLPSWWNNAGAEDRELVVFHELGHCLLDRRHDDSVKGWFPLSMMNTFKLDVDLYRYYRDDYVHELFVPGWKFL
jgi:hypothetical protein